MAVNHCVIVGLGKNKELALQVPDADLWGLAWDSEWASYDRLFEMHDLELIRSISCRPHDYEDKLCDVWQPLYMQEAYKDIPTSTKYPVDEISKITGNYFNSSIAYMIAMAIHEDYDQITVLGVNMKDAEEYRYQKPNLEYLIGIAAGLGVQVNVPESSGLCQFNPEGIKFGNEYVTYKERYGKWQSPNTLN